MPQFTDNNGTEITRKSEQYVLALQLKTDVECVVPVLRADTEEALIAIVENESLVDAKTGKADWIKGSQLEAFVHPSTVIEQGHYPFAMIRLEDWYAKMRETLDKQWDTQVMTIPQCLDRMSTNPFAGQQQAEVIIAPEAANEAST
jgi:hypothetical protein